MTFTMPSAFVYTCRICSRARLWPFLSPPVSFGTGAMGLVRKGLAPSTVNRTCAAFQAALELAAAQDPRITNQSAWRTGLAALPDAEQSRNVILPDDAVLAIISAAYAVSREFGLLVEVAAVTGARVSQLARLEVGDLQDDRSDPRLMMPSARKGRGRKRIERRPVPIPINLARVLKQAGAGRSSEAPLLTKPNGEPWRHSDHRHPFERAVTRAGLDPAEVTIYALRHSSIVRQLLANTPIRVVATLHDTSVVMIERTYSKFITDHSDALSRRALLDTTRPIGDDVRCLEGADMTHSTAAQPVDYHCQRRVDPPQRPLPLCSRAKPFTRIRQDRHLDDAEKWSVAATCRGTRA